MLDYAIKLTTAPTVEPVTLAEAKRHANVVADDEDLLIAGLIQAARELVEQDTSRALITQTWTLVRHGFWASSLELPRPPVQSVSHVKYYDSGGVLQTLSAIYYTVDTYREPAVVWLNEGYTWPNVDDRENAVLVTYVAGYGTAAAVPQRAKQAILLLVGHWYRNREAVLIGVASKEIEQAYHRLIRSLCVGRYP